MAIGVLTAFMPCSRIQLHAALITVKDTVAFAHGVC